MRILLILFSLLAIKGCSLLGAVIDSRYEDDDENYFTQLGLETDKRILGLDKKTFAEERAFKRNCKYETEVPEKCRKIEVD